MGGAKFEVLTFEFGPNYRYPLFLGGLTSCLQSSPVPGDDDTCRYHLSKNLHWQKQKYLNSQKYMTRGKAIQPMVFVA